CDRAKMHRQPFKGSFTTFSSPLDCIHMNLCGPITPASKGGNLYFLKIIDGFAKFQFIYPMQFIDLSLQRNCYNGEEWKWGNSKSHLKVSHSNILTIIIELRVRSTNYNCDIICCDDWRKYADKDSLMLQLKEYLYLWTALWILGMCRCSGVVEASKRVSLSSWYPCEIEPFLEICLIHGYRSIWPSFWLNLCADPDSEILLAFLLHLQVLLFVCWSYLELPHPPPTYFLSPENPFQKKERKRKKKIKKEKNNCPSKIKKKKKCLLPQIYMYIFSRKLSTSSPFLIRYPQSFLLFSSNSIKPKAPALLICLFSILGLINFEYRPSTVSTMIGTRSLTVSVPFLAAVAHLWRKID
ncbi:uncharacterized protein VP01_5035g1, partial [Puccinia sorghi]